MMYKKIIKKDLYTITKLLKRVFNIQAYLNITRLGGLTNHTYKVTLQDGQAYVFRIPGEGTEKLINRVNEKISTELACELGIDVDLLYFGEDGTKISSYAKNAKTMSPESMKREHHIRQAAVIFQKLHTSNINTGILFDVFQIATDYEQFLLDNHVDIYDDYAEIKTEMMHIKENVDQEQQVELVPCHNDPLCENWVEGDERLYLIDWEYAGMNDSMWDLADLSIEAGLNIQQEEFLLEVYFNRLVTSNERKRFWANKLYLDYLWTLWGKTRVPFDGEPMEQYAMERYTRLKDNLHKFNGIS